MLRKLIAIVICVFLLCFAVTWYLTTVAYRFEVQKNGFVFNRDGLIIGDSNVCIQGTWNHITEVFDGVFRVSGYENTEDGIYGEILDLSAEPDGDRSLSYIQKYFADGSGHFCRWMYVAYFDGKFEKLTALEVIDLRKGENNVWVIFADSEEEARQVYSSSLQCVPRTK